MVKAINGTTVKITVISLKQLIKQEIKTVLIGIIENILTAKVK
jgi:hypothetical protein